MEAVNLITEEQLINGFSALSMLTRQIVIDELQKAYKDTHDEYCESQDVGVRQKLWAELYGILAMKGAALKAEEEFGRIANVPIRQA